MINIASMMQTSVNGVDQSFTRLDNGVVILPIKGISNSYVDLKVRITSIEDPYIIVDIAHVIVDNGGKGRLSISISPGKKDKKWNRDLHADLNALKESGVQVIICLLEWSEMQMLNIVDYPILAQKMGFVFYHLSIKDRGIPQQKDINTLVPILVQHLTAGHHILVHCRVGLGRAGTICACCLGHFGYSSTDAINIVRERRPGAIQTRQQEDCVIRYCDTLQL